MRICILSRTTTFHNQSGGLETQLQNLAEGLARRNHQVVIISSQLVNHPKHLEENGVTYHFLPNAPHLSYELIKNKSWLEKIKLTWSNPRLFHQESRELFKKFHQEKPFAVVISQSSAGVGIARDLEDPIYEDKDRISNRCPLISIIHGTCFSELSNRFRTLKTPKNLVRFLILDLPFYLWEHTTNNKRLYSTCAKIVAVSDQLKNEFIREHSQFKEKVEVIYNGVDANQFRPGSEKFGQFTLLFIGRVAKEKGVGELLETARLLKKQGQNLQILIVGSGDDLEGYQKESEGLPVKFLGPLPYSDLPTYYQTAHVFFLPSRRQEGFPMVIAEALCAGLPVLTSGSGGIKDAIIHGDTGLISENNSPSEYTEFVKELITRPKYCQALATNAARAGREKFSQNGMVEQYEQLLLKL